MDNKADNAVQDFLSNGGKVLTENEHILQALQAKREFLARPALRDYRTGNEEADFADWDKAMDEYAEKRDALNVAIQHYKKLIKIEYALSLL